MSQSDRIAQFKHMAEADPTNEMAHFSLGNALLSDGRFAEAAASFERCVEIVPDMSRAYELAGRAMIGAGWADRAVEILRRGYVVAAGRGDLQPRDAIAKSLRELGREPPEVKTAGPEKGAAVGVANFTCGRTGRPGTRMDRPPFKGVLGEWIQANISAETWRAWIGQGTKVINELRLDFSREQDQQVYDQHMREYLGIDEALLTQLGIRQ